MDFKNSFTDDLGGAGGVNRGGGRGVSWVRKVTQPPKFSKNFHI